MKAASVVVALALFSVCLAAVTDASAKEAFVSFMQKYNKVYSSPAETQERFAVFQANLARISGMNAVSRSARYGVNQFADLSQEEFKQTILMKEPFLGPSQRDHSVLPDFTEAAAPLPANFDWRDNKKSVVTPVKDQGQCGSCWAFSATEAIESAWALAGNTLASLAPQQIVDCDVGNGDEGCDGGDTPTAYEYVIKAGGLESEADYPYTGEDDQCAFKKQEVVGVISNWTYITTSKNETQMQYGLIAKGPLSICVEADSWQFYEYGVITDFCYNQLDHCVLITGFQDYKDWDGITYQVWNIRNSWGASWGESGYLYVERGYDLCGVADEVTIPIV